MPLISSSSLAACAASTVGLSISLGHWAMANSFRYTSAIRTASALALYDAISSRNILRTRVISAPHLLKNAAASNVRTPVRFIKFLVSIMIPAYRQSASTDGILISSAIYCSTSATISQVDDEYGSIYDSTAFSMTLLPCR